MNDHSSYPFLDSSESSESSIHPSLIISNHKNDNEKYQTALQSQEIICNFFVKQVKVNQPELVLQEFKNLYLLNLEVSCSEIKLELLNIVDFNDELLFRQTLKRSCYILINNFASAREHGFINQLIRALAKQNNISLHDSLLNQWIRNFLDSEDYQEIRLFIERDHEKKIIEGKAPKLATSTWIDRHSSFLAFSKDTDLNKSKAEREAEKLESRQIREQFKLELAMYTARSKKSEEKEQTACKNPTILGDDVMHLIQKILSKRGPFSHANLANIFLKQTEGIRYKSFKKSLVKYLAFPLKDEVWVKIFQHNLSRELNTLYANHDEQVWDTHLLLRTCNRIIEALTTQNRNEPSQIFVFLSAQGKYLALAIFLLKILLICRPSYTHLETCLSTLIEHYQDKSEDECRWLIKFLDTLKVILTIYADNIDYSIVSMDNQESQYRVFSQSKRNPKTDPKI
jgi:hypothetical protein